MAHKRKELYKSDRLAVLQRDEMQCVQCKKKLRLNPIKSSWQKITLKDGVFHHIIPLVYGGENGAHDACLLCTDCHIKVHSGNEDKGKYLDMYERFIVSGRLV